MKKYTKNTEELVNKFLTGKASKLEIDELNNWYAQMDESIEIDDMSAAQWQNLKSSMLEKIHRDGSSNRTFRLIDHTNNLLKFAAVLTLLAVSYFLFLNINEGLDDKPKVEMISKSVPFGRKQTITLSDGSVVKLNSGSKIKYKKNFDADSREIELTGEAFFEVVRDESRPFVVKTDHVSTTVLGTSFNVDAQADEEEIKIGLISGSVRVESRKGQEINSVNITPGELALVRENSLEIEIDSLNEQLVIGWKDGALVFQEESFEGIIKDLKKWYGVDFRYDNSKVPNVQYTATHNKQSLETVLKGIGYSLNFDFEIEYNEVKIMFND